MNRWHDVWGVADGWQRAALVALAVATFAQTLFILIYLTRPWWRDIVGRAVMIKSSSLLIILWLSLINAFFVYRFQEPIGSLAMWLVAGAIVYQLVVLIITPRRLSRATDQNEG